MTATEPIVFVIDDDKGVRDSLRWLITSVDLAVETFASAIRRKRRSIETHLAAQARYKAKVGKHRAESAREPELIL